MNMTQTLKGITVALALTAVNPAQAATTLTNWFINPDGAGIGGANTIQVADYVDLNGVSYVNNTFTSATSFNFNEAGIFNQVLADSVTSIIPGFHSTFTATGSGDTATTVLSFTTAVLDIFSSTNVLVGEFQISPALGGTSGSAVLAANSTLPNGTVSLILEATSLTAGYFFNSAGTDLSNFVSQGLLFGFSTTNVIPNVNISASTATSLTNIYNAAFNPDIATVTNNGTTDLIIGNNGQFRVSVPEPTSMALLGFGLLGFGLSRRKQRG